MTASINRRLADIAHDVDANSNLLESGISPDITLGGATIYATRSLLPGSGNTAGDQAFVLDNSRLYIWNGNGWYNVALLNLAPSIISVQDSDGGTTPFTLSSAGAVTRITITATDSDGDPLTYAAVTDSDFTGLATISNSDNVFTITPKSSENATTESGTITFTASDGVNLGTSGVQTFTLTFVLDWSATTQQAKIQASDPDQGDSFGFAVAIDGDTAIIGARLDDASGSNAGAAYIFTRSGSTWTQQTKIQSTDIEAGDQFGYYVAIDGDTVIVGAPNENSVAGAAYIFTRSGSTWTQQAKIVASNAGASDYFGFSVAVSGDTVIVGAPYEDTNGSNAGSVYIFTRSGSTWTQQAKIQGSDTEASDQFGEAVAIDGDTAIVGAKGEDTGASGAGAVYIFTRSGSTWTQQAKIQASDREADDRFGFSVSISGDTVIVGADAEDTGGANAGSAYIFTRSGSTWTQQAKIQASDKEEGDQFGNAVAINGDTVIVAAAYEDTNGSGAGSAYIFTRSGSTWTQQAKIQASDAEANDNFGYSVAINGDTVIVGAYKEDTSIFDAGSVYVFVAGYA